jgi:hypothetical protein
VCGGAKCENQRERYPSLHRESSLFGMNELSEP